MNEIPANPLSQDFHVGGLLKFAFPTMVMMIFMGLYTVADTVFVSRFVDTNALSALNIVCPVINLTVGLGTMLAAGGNAIIARKMGEGDEERASRDFTLIIGAGVLLGIAITVFGIVFFDPIIWGLGSGSLLFPYCRAYLLTLLIFTPAAILQVLFQNLFVTAGRPGLGMMLSVGAGVVNILLDAVFMGFFGMGIQGAALGTGIGYLIPATAGIFFFIRSKGSLCFRKPVPDFSVLRESCTNGFSEMVSQAASAVTTFLFNRIMMRLLGEDGVAAVTILIYSQFLLTSLYIGFSMGVAPIISYHYGSGEQNRLRRVFRICLSFVAAVSLAVFGAAQIFGSFMVSAFAAEGTAVYEIADRGFHIFSWAFLFCGFNIFASAAFTALSNGKVSALISSLRTFVLLVPALLILPYFGGETGVWLAVPAAEAAALSVLVGFAFSYVL